MRYLDQSDYEKIKTMGGVTLDRYMDQKSTGQTFLSGAEWIAVGLAWTACGVIGIATGLLSAAWDLLKGIWDIVVAAKHIVMVILYLLSLGAVGSEDWLAVKEFLTGLKSLGHPTQIWDTYWENVKLELKTIEGPLAQCRIAEYIVRKVVSGVVSILLVFVAGVGVAKAIVSGVRMLAEFALLIRDVEILDALAEVASGARKSLRTFVKATTEVAEALVKALRNPIKTLIAVRQKINLILLAAKDQGAYRTLRGIVGELTDAEVKKWQQERNAWRELGERQAARHAEVAEDASNIAENLGDNEVPDDRQGAVDEIDGKAKALDGEAQSLEDDVKGQGAEPPASTAAADVAKLVEDDVKVTQEATGEVHEFKYLSDGRIIRCSDECLELIDSIIKRSANVPPEAGTEAASIRQATENLAKEYRGLAEQKSTSPEQLARKSQIKAEVEGLEQRMANLEAKADLSGLRRQFEIKNQKARAANQPEPYPDVDKATRDALGDLEKARARSFPYGFDSESQFQTFKGKVLSELEARAIPTDDVAVHGSSVHSPTPGDIDVAVLVDETQFKAILEEVETQQFSPDAEAKIAKYANDGLIRGYYFPRIGGTTFPTSVYGAAGGLSIQVSVVLRGGGFDIGPYLHF